MDQDTDRDFLTTIDGVGSKVADALLDRYGSAQEVLDAHIAGLKGIQGIGPTVAENIKETTSRPSESKTRPVSGNTDNETDAKRKLTRIDGVGSAVAERLLNRFGSFNAVVNAEQSELSSVPGVGEAMISRLNGTELGENNSVRSDSQPQSASQPNPTETQTEDDGFAVQNMVLTGDLGQELLLTAVAIDMPHATVDEWPNGNERLVYHSPGSEATVWVTLKGKLQIAGVSSLPEANKLLKDFLTDLPPVGLDNTEINLEIVNVVATGTIDNPVPMEGLADELHGPEADYDSTNFPGFSFTLSEEPCTFTLFGSGKVNITGAESVKVAKSALETLNETLDTFDPEELRPPNDAVHSRLDAIANELEVDADVAATAHEIVDEYDAAVRGNSRDDDGIAAMALYLASETITQSTVAQTADVSVVTVRNIAKELRSATESEIN